jgi:Protein of unknown function with PCYCGC motif
MRKTDRFFVGFLIFCVSLLLMLGCDRGTEQQNAKPAATPSPSTEPSPPPQEAQQVNESAPAQSEQTAAPVPENAEAAHHHGMEAEVQPAKTTYRIPPYFENPDAAGTLPPMLNLAAVPAQAQPAYKAAQANQRLMTQLPCFCYCDRFGHRSLYDCYAGDHAINCDVCQHEALEADQLAKQGMTPQEIRAVVIAKYHPRGAAE